MFDARHIVGYNKKRLRATFRQFYQLIGMISWNGGHIALGKWAW